MSFSRDDHHVVGSRVLERDADGSPPVRFDDVRPATAPGARLDLGDDRSGLFGPRVVARDDGEVGQARGHLAHQRPLPPIPITPAAKSHDDPGRAETSGRPQHVVQAVGCVGIVDQHLESLPSLHRFQSAGHPLDRFDPPGDGLILDAHLTCGGHRRKAVVHVEGSAQPRADRQITHSKGDT